MISPKMLMAISSGVAAPMSSPMGARMRATCSGLIPAAAKRRRRSSFVPRLPIAPM
jgi:hypothetical protein